MFLELFMGQNQFKSEREERERGGEEDREGGRKRGNYKEENMAHLTELRSYKIKLSSLVPDNRSPKVAVVYPNFHFQ